MQRPTPKQIKQETDRLEKFLLHSPDYATEKEQIRAQLKVLLTKLTDKQIYDEFYPKGNESREVLDSAMEALVWMEGDGPAPSQHWSDTIDIPLV